MGLNGKLPTAITSIAPCCACHGLNWMSWTRSARWTTEAGRRVFAACARMHSCFQFLPLPYRNEAYDLLMASEDSSYASFVLRHRRFLREYPNADVDRLKRPLRFIEEDAVECSLWPHLYWDRRLCETSARLADVRRQRRAQAACAAAEDAVDADDEEENLEGATRQSLRRSFLAKAMGPIADYAGDHELVHFVFDLFMWSDVGGKKGALRGTPMWQAMKGAPWTPQYWKVRHAAALDMQAQCGFPVAFFTWAPFEWSAPYHEWVLHQMEQLGRHRLGLAGPEALRLAHLLTELFREWVCGGGRKFGDASSGWQTSLFGHRRSDGSRVRINFVGRLEFQDGKRREVTQDYHGRAAVHLHGLVFAEEVQPSQLHNKIQAVVPGEGDPLRGYVLDEWSRTTWSTSASRALRRSTAAWWPLPGPLGRARRPCSIAAFGGPLAWVPVC